MAHDAQDVKEHLYDCLQVIGEGHFATSGVLPNASNPGLFVQGVGKIGLPLSDRDAEALTTAAHRAPFGTGTETFVDPAVRNTWEMHPHQFEIRNPAWNTTLQHAVSKVAQDLGVLSGASALLLYEPGAFFDKHKDTEKAPGMFSTLVIALPSEHTGGDVIVQHGDHVCTLSTQGLCDFGYSYLAWYADVNHSVSKIETGYRLVLTYNLVQQNAHNGHIPSMLDDHKQNLTEVLKLWDKQLCENESGVDTDGTWDRLVYILDHEYSEANISMNQLKGKDQLRMRYLSEACRDQGFCLYFAHLQYSLLGSVDEDEDDSYWASRPSVHEFIEKLESTWKLKTAFNPDGQSLAKGIELEDEDSEEAIINRPDFEDLDPDDEECDGWTGNEGCTATHFYYRTCAVVLPRASRLDFLSDAESLNVQVYVNYLVDEMKSQITRPVAGEELKKLCASTVDAKGNPKKPKDKPLSHISDDGLGAIVHAALTLNLPELADAAVRVVKNPLPSSSFSEVGKYLAESGPTTAWPRWIKGAMFCSKRFTQRANAFQCFFDAYTERGDYDAAVVKDVRFHLANCMVQPPKHGKLVMSAENAKTFIQLSDTYGHDFTYQNLLPLAKKNVNTIDFIFPLLHEVSCKSNPLSEERRVSILKDILADFIPVVPRICRSFDQDQQREADHKRRRFAYDEDLIDTSGNRLKSIPKLSSISNYRVHRFRDLFRSVISSYIQKYVQTLPGQFDGWRCQPRACEAGCYICTDLDNFLTDPYKTKETFHKVIHIRKHMEKQLRGSSCRTWTSKDRSPHSLLVEKTVEEREEGLKAWRSRCQIAYRAIDEIGFDKIHGILGEKWEDLVQFSPIRASQDSDSPRPPLGDLAQGKTSTATTGSKRKREGADIIDLTL
ncbi:MAG: hypothetical protein Q9169_002248 [Polycauliona sp. 2 TL-2023]